MKSVDRHDAGGRPIDSRVIRVNADGSELLLRWTVREFDDAGRLVKEIRKLFVEPLPLPKDGSDPAGAKDVVIRTVYDDEARTVTHIDPIGRETRSEMDELGRLARAIDPAGNVLEIEYDEAGNRRSESFYRNTAAAAPRGAAVPAAVAAASRRRSSEDLLLESKIVYQYDDQNRVSAVHDVSDLTHPLITSYEYDRRNNVVRVTDPQRRETTFEYDVRNRRVKTTDAEGAVTRFEWDDADRLVAVVDANQNRTEWIWDSSGRLAAEKRADGATWSYGYDAQGNRATSTDPNGTKTTYHRDALDRLTGLTIEKASGVLGPASITYQLDDLGRVIATETSEGVKTATSFDSLDRALRDAVRIGGGSERPLARTFDDAGQPVGLAYPSGLVISRSFDALGRIAEIRDAGTALLARWRDEGMRQVEREAGNGIVDRWAWDARSRLTSIESGPPCGAAAGCDPLRRIKYARAPAGAKEEVLRPDLALRRAYRLDRLDRVVEEMRIRWPGGMLASSMRYLLDGALNVRAVERDEVQSVVKAEGAVNSRNQLTALGPETLSWNPNGNLVARDGLTLAYDAADRLARAALADGTMIEVLRDAFGRKVRETLSFAGSSRVTDYVHDGARVIEEYLGPVLAARYVHGRGIDEIVRGERDTNLDGTLDQTLWPLQDELGTVDALTDSTGAVVARFDYAPYGLPLPIQAMADPLATSTPLSPPPAGRGAEGEGPAAPAIDGRGAGGEEPSAATALAETIPWPWLFQGREWNPHLRAYDFRARTLWPDLGRFGQEDPAGMTDSPNLYQALMGNWTGATDPSGELVVTMHGIWSSGEWAQKTSNSFGAAWSGFGADPGQDVLNAHSTRAVWWRFGSEGQFGFKNSLKAAVGWLDQPTMRSGDQMARHFQDLRAKLYASDTRKVEAIQVFAHSHGTAIMLAASRQNNGRFKLSNLVLAGSDLSATIDIAPLLASATHVHNFYSPHDDTVALIGGAGAFSFGEPVIDNEIVKLKSKEAPGLRQYWVPGISHSGEHENTTPGSTPWTGRLMVETRYASIFALYGPRHLRETETWIKGYERMREAIGGGKFWIPLPQAFRVPYRGYRVPSGPEPLQGPFPPSTQRTFHAWDR